MKKEPRRKGSFQEAIVTTGRRRLVLQIEISYGDFLKRPERLIKETKNSPFHTHSKNKP